MTRHHGGGFLGKLPVRHVSLTALCLLLAACGTTPPPVEPPSRDVYQKVNVSAYAGAGETTAKGTRYQTGSISSAAADWARFPAGTIFRVLAIGELYEVDDYTEDVVGRNAILLFKPRAADHTERFVTIEIVSWGSPRDSAVRLREDRSSTAKKILAELVKRYPQAR